MCCIARGDGVRFLSVMGVSLFVETWMADVESWWFGCLALLPLHGVVSLGRCSVP